MRAIPTPPRVVASGSMRPEITFDGARFVIAYGKGAGAVPVGVGFTTLDPDTGVIDAEQVVAEAQAPMGLAGGAAGRTLMVHAKKYVPTPEAHPGSILRGALHILGVTGEARMRAVR